MGSYAWVPGSTGCLRCVKGVPTCVQGKENGAECSASGVAAASPGFSVLQPVQMETCGLAGSFAVPAYGKCASWSKATVTLQWSIYVAGVSGPSMLPWGASGRRVAGDAVQLAPAQPAALKAPLPLLLTVLGLASHITF